MTGYTRVWRLMSALVKLGDSSHTYSGDVSTAVDMAERDNV